jgi:hypothetical protein
MTNLLTVRQLSEKYPAFPQGGIRHLIFHEKENGFDIVTIRLGRKVLISEEAFLDYVLNQKGRA